MSVQQAAEFGYINLVPATVKGPGSETLKLTAAGQKLANKSKKDKKASGDGKKVDPIANEIEGQASIQALSINMAEAVLDDRDADEQADAQLNGQAEEEEQWEDIP